MTTQLQNQLAEQLRDAHLPDSALWWPLAPGWWLLAACIIGLCLAVFLKRSKHKSNPGNSTDSIKLAEDELIAVYQQWQHSTNDAQYLSDANAVIKRLLMTVELNADIASASGEHWVQLVQQSSSHQLSLASAQALTELQYRPNCSVEVPAIHEDLQGWLYQFHAIHKTPQSEEPAEASHA